MLAPVRVFECISRYVNKVSIWVTGILALGLVLIAFFGVITREFGHSLSWNEELESYIFIWITCIGAAITYRGMGHPAVTTLVDRLPVRGRAMVRLLADLGVAAFALGFAWFGFQMSVLEVNETASSLNMPMVYPYLGLPIGGVCIFIHALHFAVEDVTAILDTGRAHVIEAERVKFAGGE